MKYIVRILVLPFILLWVNVGVIIAFIKYGKILFEDNKNDVEVKVFNN